MKKSSNNVMVFPAKNNANSNKEKQKSSSTDLSFIEEEGFKNHYLSVEMPDGSWWEIPALKIADSRASYYKDLVTDDEDDLSIYAEILSETLRDEETLIDWAENNMDWSDVCDVAHQVRSPSEIDYQEGWINGMKELVTHD